MCRVFLKESKLSKQNEVKKGLEAEKLESTNQKAQKKLQNFQELYDSNQRLIYLGKKIVALGDTYYENKRKRELMTELFKLVQIENSKKTKLSNKEKKAKIIEENRLQKEVEQKVAKIRKEKKAAKAKAKKAVRKIRKVWKINLFW